MASRMERYYKPESKTRRRTVVNQELYRKIYDISEYSNIEGIATIDKANEIDITKVKNMLKNREEYQRQKDLRSLIHKEEPKIQHIETVDEYEEDRIYDISDMLEKAKSEKKEPTDRYRNLGDTNYNILKSLKVRNDNELTRENELDKTMTNTSMLNSLNDNDLSLDLLGDFKSNTTTIASNHNAIQQLLEEAKEEEKKRKEQEKKVELDNSFFTSSLGFKKDDFEEVNKKDKKKKGIIGKIFLGLALLSITVGIIVLVYMLIK